VRIDAAPAVPLASLLQDLTWGDPPNRYHPVAWMGTAIAEAEGYVPPAGHGAQFVYGASVVIGGALGAALVGHLLERAVSALPRPLDCLAEAALLKTTFSVRGLSRAAEEVYLALQEGDLAEAQRLVRWHLVSRDTAGLDASQVAAATVESVAENASDGVMAPLLYYALGGLSAALAYRFINTVDSMWGYRDPAHEWLGKAPARLDDLANLLPARATAALFVVAAAIAGEDAGGAWRICRRDAGNTASPNAGHPMSAMAGALGVTLEKVGHYRLGVGQRRPAPEDIPRSVRLLRLASALAVGALVVIPCARRAFRKRGA